MSVTRNALMNLLIDKIPPKGFSPPRAAPELELGSKKQASPAHNVPSAESGSPVSLETAPRNRPAAAEPGPSPFRFNFSPPGKSSARDQERLATLQSKPLRP